MKQADRGTLEGVGNACHAGLTRSLGRRICPAFACAVLLLAAGCNRAAQTSAGIAVETQFTPSPARVGRGTVSVKLQDAAARPVIGARVTAEANMSHPGMAPVVREAREIEPGRYEADVELGMRGDWVILLHIKLRTGQELERQIALTAVKAE